ncbi:ATP-binding protein [Coprothermobacter platensis]|uniref:ATP-binding protein n=1 Tax=Coprothermobacter platensis TaxID=108819 RepID=UPI0003A78214|nr:ATP-binding protein [Coprothermobacter platensis]
MERLAASYRLDYDVRARDYVSGGEVSSALRAILKQLSLPPDLVRRCCVACYEAEMNIIIHSFGGHMSIEIFPDRLEMIAQDSGPGIEDLQKAMQEGYSTASEEAREMGFGAGMGLPNIKANTDYFDIQTGKEGTTLTMKVLFLKKEGE